MSQSSLPRSSSRSKRSTTNLANLRLAPLSAKYTEQSADRSGPKTPYDEAAEATLAKYVYRQGRSLPSTPGISPGAVRRHAGGGLSRRESMLDDDELPEIFHQYARSGRDDDGLEPLTKAMSEAALSGHQLPLAGQGVAVKKKPGHKRSRTVGTNTPRSKSKSRLAGDDDWLTHTGATANALLLESKGATWLSSRPSATNLVIADDDDEGYEEMAALSATSTRVTEFHDEGQKTPKQERWGSRFGSRPASRHASRRGSVAAGTRTPTSNADQLAEYFERASLQQQQYQQGPVLVDDSEDETDQDENDQHLTELTKDRSFGLGPYVDKLMFSVFNLPEDESGAETGNEEAETAAEAKARRLREARRRQAEKDKLVALPAPADGKDGEKVGVWQDVSWLVNVAQRTFL